MIIGNFIGIGDYKGSTGEETTELTVDTDNVQTFAAADFKSGDRTGGEIASTPQSVYCGGKSLLAYPMAWGTIYSTHGMLAVYDKNNGYYPAPIELTAKGAESDRHMTPKIAVNEDGSLISIHERTHSGNIFVFSGDADLSKFVEQPQITATAARHNLYRTATGWALICQQADDNMAVFTLNADGSSWSASSLIVTGSSADRPYPSRPFGPIGALNGKYYIGVTPQYVSGTNFRVKFILVTEDFVTFTNIDETHSFDAGSPVDYTTLQSNGYAAIGATNGTQNYGNMASALAPDGSLFIFSLDQSLASTSELTTTTYENGEWVHRTCDTGFSFTAPNAVDTTIPSCAAARSADELYLMISIGGQPGLIKSTDKGATWDLVVEDLLPGKSYYRGQWPFNTHDIPDNENFAIWFVEDVFDGNSENVGDIYALTAAFGTVQPETSTPFTETVAESEGIAGARAIYSSDDWDSTVTGFFDKSGNNRTGAKIGTPTLSNGAVVFNGTNQGIQIGTPADFADDKFSLHAVAKWTSGTAYLISLSTSGQAGRYCTIALTSTGLLIRKTDSGATKYECEVSFNSSVFNLIQVFGDGRHFRVKINGVEMIKGYSLVESNANYLMNLNGSWGDNITGLNSARIASVDATTDLWGGLELKEWRYDPVVLSRNNEKKLANFYANKCALLITNNVE